MRPDESGAMRVAATEVPVLEEGGDGQSAEGQVAEKSAEPVSPSEIPVLAWMKKSLEAEDKSEETVAGGEQSDAEEATSTDEDAGPSWAAGGNPWNALGLTEKAADEVSVEVNNESGNGDASKQELPSLDFLDDEEPEPEEEPEEVFQEQKESRLSLIIAVVIIIVVGGGGLMAYLMRDTGSPGDKAAIEKVAQTSKSNEDEKKAPEIVEKTEPIPTSSEKSANEGEVAATDSKAIERPAGSSIDSKASAANTGPKPEMATARVDVSDEVAVRMHQEGERAIRRFYRARSVEERSAFVVNPGQVMSSMRKFYDKLGKLPTIRYLEFKGKLHDPTSGFRFGVFDVHEKENEKSHRWCVVEIEPSQYALDWGFYEQLEGSSLITYLAKAQSSSKRFRFLMKLGETISAIDSPWDETAVQVHLQLPLAGGGGAETILLKKTDAENFGVLKELADGQMKIGRVKLDWIDSDKDPGSKVPTITELEGWGAWSKPKLRGLN